MHQTVKPKIGLLISPERVEGCAVFGETLEERQQSLALLDLLEPDLIQVQDLLNTRIKLLKKNKAL